MEKDNLFIVAQSLTDNNASYEQIKSELQKKYSSIYTTEEIETAIYHAALPELKSKFKQINYIFIYATAFALLSELFRKLLFSEIIQPGLNSMMIGAKIGVLLALAFICISLLRYALKFKRVAYRGFILVFFGFILRDLGFQLFPEMNTLAKITIVAVYLTSICSIILGYYILKKVWPNMSPIFSKY